MDINVLLIEDDHEDSIIISKTLSSIVEPRYKVEWINSFQDALVALAQNKHDVCLVDYKLRDGDGLQLIEHAANINYKAPIILLTGFSSREIDDLAIAKGASDYIPKDELSSSVLDRSIRHAIERRVMEDKLLYLADHDALTGLANRNRLNQHLERAMSRAQRIRSKLALLFVDLDRFKMVNDSLGHTVGDELLIDAANRIQKSIRKEDILARIGGDEFILLIEDLDSLEQANSTAEKVLEVLTIPFKFSGHTIYLSASIGIAFNGKNKSIDDLMKSADIALYRAKNLGRNQACFFNERMNKKLHQNLQIEKGLRHAINNNELKLVYQPQVDLKSQNMVGCEALIRWDSKIDGLMGPDQFLGVAKDTGLIFPISEWVLKEALAQAAQWQFDSKGLKMCVNLAPQQLAQGDLVEFILGELEHHDYPPNLLELEITEDMLIKNLKQSKLLLDKLRDIGVSIAIDDFGTGYSSLSYLKDLPFDVLKVDKSFTLNLLADAKNTAITDAVINLAHRMGIQVVAEGVETLPQLDVLAELACDCVQGYFFSKPLSATQMDSLLYTEPQLNKYNIT